MTFIQNTHCPTVHITQTYKHSGIIASSYRACTLYIVQNDSFKRNNQARVQATEGFLGVQTPSEN